MTIDSYGSNPIADVARAQDPELFAAISKIAPAPQMFAGGTSDLPAFTASGVDPTLLLKLPFGVRHHAASIADPAELYSFFEQHASNPDARVEHDGLHDAEHRFSQWLSTETRTPEEMDAEYEQFFPKDATALREAERKSQARAEYQEGARRYAAARGSYPAHT